MPTPADESSPQSQRVRVLLADNSGVMLKAVEHLLSSAEEVQLVAITSNFAEAVRLTFELKPDVVVVDIHMAERVRDDLRKLRAQHQTLRVLAVTAATVGDEIEELATKLEADTVLDKMNLYTTLVPTILNLART